MLSPELIGDVTVITAIMDAFRALNVAIQTAC